LPPVARSSSLPHPAPPAGAAAAAAPVKPALASTASAPLPTERSGPRPQAALLKRVLYWAPLLAACVAALLIGFVGGIVFSAPNAAGPELGRRLGPSSPLAATFAAPAPAPASSRHYNPAAWAGLATGGNASPAAASKLVPGAAAAGAASDAASMALLAHDGFSGRSAAAGAAQNALVTEDGPAASAEQMLARALQTGHLAALGAAGPGAAPGEHFATGASALAVPDVSALDEVLRRLRAGANLTAHTQREHTAIKDDQGKLLPLAPKLKVRAPG
jgi:hypothetical protein